MADRCFLNKRPVLTLSVSGLSRCNRLLEVCPVGFWGGPPAESSRLRGPQDLDSDSFCYSLRILNTRQCDDENSDML